MLAEPLMDKVHAWSFKKDPTFTAREAPSIMIKYRMMLRTAQRFVLDDDFVELACDMSHERDMLPQYALLARLPFDEMWVEYDLWHKVNYLWSKGRLAHKPESGSVSHAIGLLLVRDKPSNSRWVCTEFYNTNGHNHVVPLPVDFVFDPEGGYAEVVSGNTTWKAKTLSRLLGVGIDVEWVKNGDVHLQKVPPEWTYFGEFDRPALHDGVLKCDTWAEKIGATINPLWMTTPLFAEFNNRAREVIISDAHERSGGLRQIISMLALINNVPKKVQPIRAREGTYLVGMTRQHYFDHSLVTISIPKERQLERVNRKLKVAARKRARELVRGHWRLAEHKGNVSCHHLPVMQEENLAMCVKCQNLIRWINPYERGDASLGWTHHDYRVGLNPRRKNDLVGFR